MSDVVRRALALKLTAVLLMGGAAHLAGCRSASKGPAPTGSAVGQVDEGGGDAVVEASPARPRRVAAEWEPATGVLVSWPPYLPRQLFIELAGDVDLYVLVADAEVERDAETWFARWGIPAERVRFLTVPASQDAAWTRDYGPQPIFTHEMTLVLGDARYDQSTPNTALACDAPLLTPANGGWGERFLNYDVTQEDAAPTRIADALGLQSMTLPFVLTGGNVLTDGRGGAISTCILSNENNVNGVDDAAFFDAVRTKLGIDRYAIIPNFEDNGIQHIDCLVKMLDDRRLLVARPPADDPHRVRYDRLVDEHLSRLRTATGDRWDIVRLDTPMIPDEGLAAYTNSLILNKVIYVPLFGIPGDDIALTQWREAMPGYTVKGFTFDLKDEPALPDRAHRMYPKGIGWRSFDALHCRTRAVWDADMLHIEVEAPREVENGVEVAARIVAYSGEPLLADALRAHWRLDRDSRWRSTPLRRDSAGVFRATIPTAAPHDELEYYIGAADRSGRTAVAPPAAPHIALPVHAADR